MPRVSDAKLRLMDAARSLIWENSYGATSVDSICEKAGVKKGSFYYFFPSKALLASEALEAGWQAKRIQLDEIFSSATPPLERLDRYFTYVYERQAAVHGECGSVLGCSLFSLGCEISTQDPLIRSKVQELLERQVKYFETALRDAHAEGSIYAPNARTKARALFAYFQGTLTQARILNSLEILRDARQVAFELLGLASPPHAHASASGAGAAFPFGHGAGSQGAGGSKAGKSSRRSLASRTGRSSRPASSAPSAAASLSPKAHAGTTPGASSGAI